MLHGKHGRTPLIGPVGGLVQLHGSSSEEISRASRSSRTTSLLGQVTEQRGPARNREWTVGVGSAYPEHFHALRQLEAGLLGIGPFWWFDEAAQVTNMLSPEQSMLAEGTFSGGFSGGAGQAADGTRFFSSVTGLPGADVHLLADVEDQQMAVPFNAPLVFSVCATAFSESAGSITVDEVDPQGDLVEPHTVQVPVGTVLDRVTVALVTSARTVAVRLRTTGLLKTALPAVTLTASALPWAEGRGCATASFELPSESIQKAVAHPNGRRSGYSMNVYELG